MKKIIFMFILFPNLIMAEGPKYQHKEPEKQLEFENVYKDLRTKASLSQKPTFLAVNSVTDSNVTGDNTTVTVDFDSEIFDNTSNFASDTFTAPVPGYYLFSAGVSIRDTAAGNKCEIRLVTSNRTYSNELWPTSNIYLSLTVIADMDASDTAYVNLNCSGATLIVDVQGTNGTTIGSAESTFFSGSLLN